ncbi:hypothetical protein H2O64_18875 [Kordia sp. YSTF-M3]|uniref:Uncharacterized protein n=1 Tax=Kordia aestuariivivens TaxID=2759037 RepID=A0ABR7QDV1_9FLAO|nr:hypothetical protein [Kordia aestuariivivens]MBC8756745.1 hypothetical protein [Kordia aestuariivivens]
MERKHILNLIKQIPFLLVLCAMLLQPIANTFSIFSDTSFELVDYDFEDDTEEEVEDKTEKDTKIEPQRIHSTIAYCDLSNINANHYLQQSRWSCNLDILIPPPRHA